MDRATAAEWMLARVVEQSRASEIMGDLLETRPEQGSLRFWLSVLGLLISFTWRPVVGLVLAYFAALFFLLFPLAHSLADLNQQRLLLQFGSAEYLSKVHWIFFISGFGNMTILFWIVAAFALVRFGIRNISTQMSMGLALVGTAFCLYLWIPAARPALLAISVLVLTIALIDEKRRQSLAIVLASVAIAWMAGHLCPFWPSHRAANALIFGMLGIFLPIIEVAVFTYLHGMISSPGEESSPEAL
jgi:hypothetical protein